MGANWLAPHPTPNNAAVAAVSVTGRASPTAGDGITAVTALLGWDDPRCPRCRPNSCVRNDPTHGCTSVSASACRPVASARMTEPRTDIPRAAVLRGPREVAEDEAGAALAGLYGRLRDVLGAPFVP